MATYYVAPNGDDTRTAVQAQNIATPWKTWAKGANSLVAGDILYIRGGSYPSPFAVGASDWLVTIANRVGTALNPILISAYPGEQPVMDFNGFLQTQATTGIRVNKCSWVKFSGLWVKNLLQNGNNIIAGWEFHESTDITMDQIWVDNIGGAGIRQANPNGLDVIRNDRFTYINCDASRCGDANDTGGGKYGNADGFDANSGTTTYINCRAWWNSDDGFDTYTNDSPVHYQGCWSFWNGYQPGTFTDPGAQADGMGFKWGVVTTPQPNTILKTYTRCLAFENKSWGFDQNLAVCKAEFYNNTTWNNKRGGWATGYFPTVNPREASILRNNISYAEPVIGPSDPASLVMDHNSWQVATPTNASFASLSNVGVDGPRGPGGSLPVLNFLKLSAGSNQIDQGIADADFNSLGLTFNGAAPDLGAYEFQSAVVAPAQGASYIY